MLFSIAREPEERQCGRCGWATTTLRDWERHWNQKHPNYRKIELLAGTHPEKYFWSSKKATSKNDDLEKIG